MRQVSGWTKEYYEEYRDFRKNSENAHMARYFGKLSRALQELSETALAGAYLLEASQKNNAALLQGVGEAFAYSEARRLVGPVTSHLELQNRVKQFVALMDRKSSEVAREIDDAYEELKTKAGVEF